jgi:hypothetical protein
MKNFPSIANRISRPRDFLARIMALKVTLGIMCVTDKGVTNMISPTEKLSPGYL